MIVLKTSLEYLIPVITGTILFALLITFIIYFIVLYRKSQDKFKYEQDLLKQALLHAEIEIKEQTLVNVSRELHDNYGQIASLIKINLNMVSKDMDEQDQAKIEESITLIKQLIRDIKSLSSSLNGENIRKIGWIKMIENDIIRVNRIGRVQINFVSEDKVPSLGHEKEVILYRVSQEILNNMLKHANATVGQLSIRYSNEKLELSYSDDGDGFDLNTPLNQSGSGLNNMEERCKMIGASFSVVSSPANGTQIQIKF